MGGIAKSASAGKTQYTVSYSDMRGVDFSATSESGRGRYAYLENMYRDYDTDGGTVIESVPGFRRLLRLGKRINAIYSQKGEGGKDYVIVHAENILYRSMLTPTHSLSEPVGIATVKDVKSAAFRHGYDLYVLDGEKIVKITKDGAAITVGEEGAMPYVPTIHTDGVAYEQRNLLTDKFKESFTVSSTDLYSYGTHALNYRIIDDEKKLCAVVGIADDFTFGDVYVPSYATIGTEKYRVYEIADNAFNESAAVYNLKINEGVVRIGKGAFSGCNKMSTVFCPDSVELIDNGAFANCTALLKVYLGTGLTRVGEGVFEGCDKLNTLYYAADAESLESIENSASLDGYTIMYRSVERSVSVDIPLHTPALSVEEVTVDGNSYPFISVMEKENVASVLLSSDDRRLFEGKEIIISATAQPREYSINKGMSELLSNPDYTGTGADAVTKCRICESFDGRIFLAGNPSLPNTVIYSAKDLSGNNNPLYFGAFNYFNDGVGAFPVISMLAAGDSLAVFKAEDDGGGSIFYHTPRDTGIDLLPRIYPVSYIHSGISAVGESISFFDDPLFVSKNGISALDKQQINLERSIACRSHNVNSHLLRESLPEVKLAKWCGYLAVCAKDRIYLADSRATFMHSSGYYEYEWYYMKGVGTYKNATRAYRYASIAPSGYEIHPSVDSKVNAIVMSVSNGTELVYFTEEDGHKYAVYPTEEMVGGDFSPMCAVLSIDEELLIFGTESGDVCIFNNDMRGIAPEDISENEDFDVDAYGAKYSDRLHPYFYAFEDHAPTYALKTVSDDCGIPHMCKNTVKHSLAMKCAVRGEGELLCETGTDRNGYSETASFNGGELDFSSISFASLGFETAEHTTLPLSEKEKNWIEKQIAVSGGGFRTPIAVYSITYRFTVKGKIKKNR